MLSFATSEGQVWRFGFFSLPAKPVWILGSAEPLPHYQRAHRLDKKQQSRILGLGNESAFKDSSSWSCLCPD